MAFCSKCGTANDDGTRFCGSCGAALAATLPSLSGQSTIAWSSLSLGGKISGIGSALGLLLFFFPWVDVYGSAKFSGIRLAFQDKPKTLFLLAVPATAIGVLWFLYQSMTTKSNSKQGANVGLAGGIISLLAMLWLYSSAKNQMGGMGSKIFTEWFWLAFVASIAVIVGAVKDRTS
jgi:hypothetical protein